MPNKKLKKKDVQGMAEKTAWQVTEAVALARQALA
jgi:hypothetical protein